MVEGSSVPKTTGCRSSRYYWNNVKSAMMYSEINTYQKLTGLKNKDLVAFSWMYDKYSVVLYALILKVTPDVNNADLILLGSFKRMWERIDTYDESKSSLFIWMAQITLQNCYRANLSIANRRTHEIETKIEVMIYGQ